MKLLRSITKNDRDYISLDGSPGGNNRTFSLMDSYNEFKKQSDGEVGGTISSMTSFMSFNKRVVIDPFIT